MDSKIESKIDAFFTQFKYQEYKKGELLVRAEDTPAGVFYLKKGTVKEYIISQKGDELIVNMFKPVSFFPMSWAINRTTNNYFFEATTDVQVWRAPQAKTIDFVKNNPDVMYDLLGRVYKGLEGMLSRMSYLMGGNAYSRLTIELLISARRFGRGEDETELHISEKELAAQSGMTRETISREVKVLKEKNIIVLQKNKILIPSLQKLQEELGIV